MFSFLPFALLQLLLHTKESHALPYLEEYVDYNLNANTSAVRGTNPIYYNGSWDGHTYMASPANWRIPFYTIFLDRFVNGDPTNDNANGTVYEHDVISNQFRNGGDIYGLEMSLDYLYGMGIRVSRQHVCTFAFT